MLLLVKKCFVEASCGCIFSVFNDETCRRSAIDVAILPPMKSYQKLAVITSQNESNQSSPYINSDDRDFVTLAATDSGTFRCFDFLTVTVEPNNETGTVIQACLVD